jgi:hypothetical protein
MTDLAWTAPPSPLNPASGVAPFPSATNRAAIGAGGRAPQRRAGGSA